MNKRIMVTLGLTALLSFTGGFAAGYFLAKRKLEAELKGEISPEEKSQALDERLQELVELNEALAEGLKEGIENPDDELAKNVEAMANDIFKQESEEDEMTDKEREEQDLAEMEEMNAIGNMDPYEITEDEYIYGMEWHDKLEITYYSLDEIYADEEDDSIVDPLTVDNYCEGWLLDKLEKEKPVMWVRNEFEKVDVALRRVDDFYSRRVLKQPLTVKQKDKLRLWNKAHGIK